PEMLCPDGSPALLTDWKIGPFTMKAALSHSSIGFHGSRTLVPGMAYEWPLNLMDLLRLSRCSTSNADTAVRLSSNAKALRNIARSRNPFGSGPHLATS